MRAFFGGSRTNSELEERNRFFFVKKLVIGGISTNVANYVTLYSISKEVMTLKPMFTLSNIFISLPIG